MLSARRLSLCLCVAQLSRSQGFGNTIVPTGTVVTRPAPSGGHRRVDSGAIFRRGPALLIILRSALSRPGIFAHLSSAAIDPVVRLDKAGEAL